MITEFDPLAIYYGEPLHINDALTIKQATLGDIISIGEKQYWSMINLLTALPCDYISLLYDMGINYMEISDIEFFYLIKNSLDKKYTSVLFGDLDFTKFELCKRDDGEVVLFEKESKCILDEISFSMMTKYLCTIHLITKKRRRAGNKHTYLIQVDVDRQDKLAAATKPNKSQLLPMISSLVNHPGFKHSIQETKSLTLYQFMDCVSRISTMMASERIALGYYSGSIDPKKINIKKELDWMRDLQS